MIPQDCLKRNGVLVDLPDFINDPHLSYKNFFSCHRADKSDSNSPIKSRVTNNRFNGFANTKFIVADVFDYLVDMEEKKEQFDVIILDPPAFTKSKNSVKNASKGYREINYKAMKLLRPGGFLVTCSCSEYMPRDLFMKIILASGNDAHKRLRLVESRAQGPDHPVILGHNVSDYLKCIIVQVNDR